MNNLPTKSCLACNKILKGRIDKKFCNDRCRNYYNNMQKTDGSNYTRNIINVLRKNRRILNNLLDTHVMVKTTHDRLVTNGFQFNYHTHRQKNRKGGDYVFCFETGYLALEHERYLVVRRMEK